MSRRYFGTDGVRGIVGVDLTPDLVEQIGKAATLWAGGGRVLVGRDTRESGPALERAAVRGVVSAGGTAVLGGVLPTPAIAYLADELGLVISASHNPPDYNGVKLFRDGGKLVDEQEEEVEGLLDASVTGGGSVEELEDGSDTYLARVIARCGSNLAGIRIGIDCANGAFSELAPDVFSALGAEVHAIGTEPDGKNINMGSGATDLAALQLIVTREGLDLGVAFDGDGDRMLAVDAEGEPVDGDQILAVLTIYLGVGLVAVTVMTNLGFHRLMGQHRVRVVTTPVGDRYVLQALRKEGGILGGEQSGHIIYLRDHVTGDGLAAALVLCAAIKGRTLREAVSVLQRYPQAKENVPVVTMELTVPVLQEVERMNEELQGTGRVLVRPSGTEPVVRVLAEAETRLEADDLCGKISALVRRELG